MLSASWFHKAYSESGEKRDCKTIWKTYIWPWRWLKTSEPLGGSHIFCTNLVQKASWQHAKKWLYPTQGSLERVKVLNSLKDFTLRWELSGTTCSHGVTLGSVSLSSSHPGIHWPLCCSWVPDGIGCYLSKPKTLVPATRHELCRHAECKSCEITSSQEEGLRDWAVQNKITIPARSPWDSGTCNCGLQQSSKKARDTLKRGMLAKKSNKECKALTWGGGQVGCKCPSLLRSTSMLLRYWIQGYGTEGSSCWVWVLLCYHLSFLCHSIFLKWLCLLCAVVNGKHNASLLHSSRQKACLESQKRLWTRTFF